ncbi:hypothetical protein PR048_004408 [Dryococelus australis]|uniref:Uncharacterized protein n=1 Tax=Dryococelus australis TaxID=614101 RepID=A0ABQ9I5D6_9NEOP|nr:hypothetical protein PR048_004408 [Dryococelus australis]
MTCVPMHVLPRGPTWRTHCLWAALYALIEEHEGSALGRHSVEARRLTTSTDIEGLVRALEKG